MSTTTRWLEREPLQTGSRSASAADHGDASSLEIVVTVHTAAEGDSPALCVHHSPTDDDSAPLDFREPCRVSLLRTGRVWLSVPRFTRYLSWTVDGTLDSTAEVSVDIVGRP